jgi:hypothetical protein
VKPSMRSSRSRITLVGYDAELDFKLDTAYGTARNAKVFTWLDHLLAVFCIHRQGRDISSIPARSIQGEEDEVRKMIADGIEQSLIQVTGPSPLSMDSTCLRSFNSKGRVKTFHTQGSQMYDRHRQPSRKHRIQNLCH